MKKVLFIWLFTLIPFVNTIAQNNLPPVYEITTDTAVNISLDDSHWQMLEDTEGNWTIDDVRSPPVADKFHPNTTKPREIFSLDYSINTFWFRYRFKNTMGHEAKIALPKNVTYADFFSLATGNKWNHKLTGTTVPWSKRNDLKRITTITYLLQPGEELLIYERDNFDYLINTPDFLEINFGFTDRVIQKYYDENDSSLFPSFMFGIFLLAALFNLYFFLIVRGRVYLLFSLTLFSHGFSRFFSSNAIFFKEHPIANWYLVYGLGVFFFFFLIHFVRYFLKHLSIFRGGINTSLA